MKIRPLASLLGVAGVVMALVVPAGTASAGPAIGTLVSVRTGSHAGFERVVWEFSGPLPTTRSARKVAQVYADGSGFPVAIAGREFIDVNMHGVHAHNEAGQPTARRQLAPNQKNLVELKQSGDYEAVVSWGVGAWKVDSFRLYTLTNPSRVVLDVKGAVTTSSRKVYFGDTNKFIKGTAPYTTVRYRDVPATTPASGVLHRLFAGPAPSDATARLFTQRSGATGFKNLSIVNGVAKVTLTGGCTSAQSPTFTIADQIRPTLKQFSNVQYVKIYDPSGRTLRPTGRSDSNPECLEP